VDDGLDESTLGLKESGNLHFTVAESRGISPILLLLKAPSLIPAGPSSDRGIGLSGALPFSMIIFVSLPGPESPVLSSKLKYVRIDQAQAPTFLILE